MTKYCSKFYLVNGISMKQFLFIFVALSEYMMFTSAPTIVFQLAWLFSGVFKLGF